MGHNVIKWTSSWKISHFPKKAVKKASAKRKVTPKKTDAPESESVALESVETKLESIINNHIVLITIFLTLILF